MAPAQKEVMVLHGGLRHVNFRKTGRQAFLCDECATKTDVCCFRSRGTWLLKYSSQLLTKTYIE